MCLIVVAQCALSQKTPNVFQPHPARGTVIDGRQVPAAAASSNHRASCGARSGARLHHSTSQKAMTSARCSGRSLFRRQSQI